MSKWTPGPWKIWDFDESQKVIVPDRKDKRQPLIAIISTGYDRPDGEANAQAIAALPELVEACKEALESRNMQISWSTLKKIQQALVKAEGKEGERCLE